MIVDAPELGEGSEDPTGLGSVRREAAARGLRALEEPLALGGVGDTSSLQATARLIEITVTDAGAGIAAGHLQRIFDPFYQVESLLTRETEGLGLGLPICRQIISLHGGMLWAESVLGAGSTFRVLLPRMSEEIAASALPAASARPR